MFDILKIGVTTFQTKSKVSCCYISRVPVVSQSDDNWYIETTKFIIYKYDEAL